MELFAANKQWSTRPADERFTSLHSLYDYASAQKELSRSGVVSSKKIKAMPDPMDEMGNLMIQGPTGGMAEITHYAFGQLCARAGTPAEYLRTLPAPLAADCLNYGLTMEDTSDVGILLTRAARSAQFPGHSNPGLPVSSDDRVTTLRAATGPNYGRIWNEEIARTLCRHFGDGISGDWKVPGEFGKDVVVTKENTTLYCGDRSMFVFLADEHNRVEVPNRRNGAPGSLARGFFVWNSEVGAASLGIGFFLFDYVCCNRIVWGAQEYKEVKIRHTSGAPDRWLDEVRPALMTYANSAASPVEALVQSAMTRKVEKVEEFMANRFGKKIAERMNGVHQLEEGRPIETVWDVVTGATAYARSMESQPERVGIEREAGSILQMAA